MLNVILAKSYDDARTFLESANARDKEWVAIETEYGDKVIDETTPNVNLALNHHGDLQHMEAPALVYKLNPKRYDNFIVSHIDLDVLFGILWTAGWLKKTNTTKELSKYVATADILGFHVAKELLSLTRKDIEERYLAIGYLLNSWVINDNGKNIVDISKEIHKLLLRIKDIILDGATQQQVEQYKKWFEEQEKVAKKHLVDIKALCSDSNNLFIFRAPFSLTTAYQINDTKADIIVQYNEQAKSISLSCFDEEVANKFFGEDGVINPLKKFFGEKAGGKKTIGGTPRDQNIQPEILNAFVEFLFREYFNVPEILDLTEYIEVNDSRELVIKDREFIEKYRRLMPSAG